MAPGERTGRRLRLMVAAAFPLSLAGLAATAQDLPEGDPERGASLYAEYCASCHGENLEGAENWQSPGDDGRYPAPPHDETGHTWHHDDFTLFDYTRLGGAAFMARRGSSFDSGMPGFGDVLGDGEIADILAFIRSSWPENIRRVQAARTEAEALRRGANE